MKSIIKKALFLLVSTGLSFSVLACDLPGDKTLSELLFMGVPGSIFICKPKLVKGESVRAEVVKTYFGRVTSKEVQLESKLVMDTGKLYLVYSAEEGNLFYCGGENDKRTKELEDEPDSVPETVLIQQFSNLIAQQRTGSFVFKNELGKLLAVGDYTNGKPTGIWKHYYPDGNLKSIYDFTQSLVTEYACNGFIQSKTWDNGTLFSTEKYSQVTENKLIWKEEFETIGTDHYKRVFNYWPNGTLKMITTYKNDSPFVSKVEEFDLQGQPKSQD